MKNKYIYLIWFIALLPIMILRDFTPNNELRYLSIVDEAISNGNIFTFTNQGEIYADKPPLHFWLMMLGKLLLGEHRMWYYSLLSFIPSIIIVITMTRWVRTEYNINEPTAILMLITTVLFTGVTLVVRMDMLMNMFIVLSLYTFYKMYVGKSNKLDQWLFPVYLFLALFSKGPLGLLIPLISTTLFLLYNKRMNEFMKYWGWKTLMVIVICCIIWFAGAYFEGGREYINNLLFHQTVGRGIDSFHHKEPFYYYAISIWYSLAPWSFLAIGLFIASILKKKITNTLEEFFSVIIISSFVMLSLISSKLAIYSLPIIPFLIFLTIIIFDKFDIQNRWIKLSIALPAVIFVFALPTILYISKLEEMQYLNNWIIYSGAGVITITGLLVFYLLYQRRDIYQAINTMVLGFLMAIFIIGWSMPHLNDQLGWASMCEKAKMISKEHMIDDYLVYKISRAENMDVYLGKDIIEVSREDILKEQTEKRLLMLRLKDIRNDLQLSAVLSNKEMFLIGKHAIVIL